MALGKEPTIVRRTDGPVHRTPFGDVLRWLAGGDETSGAWSLHERTAPPGARSTPHLHQHVSEAFYVVDGEMELEVGSQGLTGGAGTFVLASPGVMHAWRTVGERDAHVLVIFSPAVDLRYFEELDRLTGSQGGRPEPAAIAALAQKYGLD